MAEKAELKAVLFDLDGVLVDTSVFHARAWAELVRGVGVEPPADLEERVKGISRMASLKIALGEAAARYSEAELVEMASRKNAHYLEAVKAVCPADLYDGALELFDDLSSAGVRIVLGSASKNARPVLDALGITDRFDAIADGFAYTHGKPHPDVFLTGARMVGAAPHECVVVEDAAAGITAALDGGFVAVGMGRYESLQHAHLFIEGLRELSTGRLSVLREQFAPDRWRIEGDASSPRALGFRIEVAGEPAEVITSRCHSELFTGFSVSESRLRTASGVELAVTERHFADATDPRRLFQQLELEPVAGSVSVTIRAGLGVAAGEAVAPDTHTVGGVIADGVAVATALVALDRPHAACGADTGTGSVTVGTEAREGAILYLDRVAVCLPGGSAQAAAELAAAAPRFAEARIPHGSALRVAWSIKG